MKTSKLFITSLLAAAAMGAVPAFATVSTGSVTVGGTWDNDASSYLTATKDSVGQYYFVAGSNTPADAIAAESAISDDIVIGGTNVDTDSTKGLIITDSNQKCQALTGTISGVGILAIKASTSHGTSQLVFSGDVSGFSGKFYVNTAYAHTLRFMGASTTALSGTGTIETNKTLVYEKETGDTYAIANSSISAQTLQFTGGADYTISSTLTGYDATASNNTLTISAGTTTFTGSIANFGTITVASGATADFSNTTFKLGAVRADSVTTTISNNGTVTFGAGTVFDINSYVEGAQMLGGVSTTQTFTIANLSIGGYLANQRGSAAFSVSDSGVLTLDSYTEGPNYSLTWHGGDSGVWKVNGTGWTNDTTDEVTFQNGDSVTFGTGTTNAAALEGSLKVSTMTVSAATSLTGTGTIRVDAANLTTTAALTLGENVVLDLGSISAATTVNNVVGTGTVKVATTNHVGLTLGEGFTGTIEHTGNIDANTFAGNQNAKYVLSSGSMWGGRNLINISNDIHFAADYTIGAPSFTVVNFTGALTQAEGTTLTIANSGTTATFSGTANLSQVTLSAGTLTISGNLAVAGKISVCKGGTVTQSAGTVSATRLVLNDNADQAASFYTLTGGVFNITGMGKTGGVTNDTTTTNAVLIGHWKNGTSKLTVSEGTLNVTEGFTVISWDSAGTLEVSGGTANLYGVSLNTYRGNAANVTLSSGRLNLGAGGLTYGSGTNGTTNKTVTLSGGKLGALTDWSSDVAMSLSGNVTIDTTKQVVGANGASANAEGNVGASITLAGALSGDGASLTKTGAGTLTLRGNNTFTGGTVIEAGTVVAAHANALGTTKGVEVQSGATLNLGAPAVTVAGLSGEGSVGLAGGTTSSTLTVNGGGVFTGRLTNVSLVKQGAETLELSGTNMLYSSTYDDGSGWTTTYQTISAESGTLRIVTNSQAVTCAGATTVAGGAALEVSVSAGVSVSLTSVSISAGGKLIIDLSNYASATETFALDIITESALSYNGVGFASDCTSLLGNAVELKGWTQTGWAESLAYDGSKLSLTMTIPEPSMFGLLAGLGALALAGTRRRRRK